MRMEGEKSDRRRLVIIAAVALIAFLAFQRWGPDIDVEQLLEDLAAGLGDWTYALVGGLAFLETGAFVGLIFPGETAVILGGAVAGQGETEIVLTIAIVWFCAWAGDTTSFFIGRRLGRGFVIKHGPKVRITEERFEQVERYFARHGGKTILVGRFVGLVRALAPFIAGSSGMQYRAFVPFSVLGTGLWASAFSILGYVLSNSIDKATEIAGKGALVFGATIAVIVGAVVVSRYLRKPENRERVAARIESVPGIRRLLPQLRFLWGRLTPGGLGLEFTTLMSILSVSLFVLVGYAITVSGDPGPTTGDREAIDVVESLRAGWLTDVAKGVTALGSTAALLPIAIAVAGVFAWYRRWAELAVMVGALAIILIGVPVLKEVIDRPRPDGGIVEATGQSYPSGHAAHAVFFAWLAIVVAVRVRPGWTYGTLVIVVGLVLAAAIGLTRVYLGVHYLSDVSGGWALGVTAFAGCAATAMVVMHIRNNLTRSDS
jgi:membrane protein DedA with SNARE-associated domain/membrane-associated phospholipid phosphatase